VAPTYPSLKLIILYKGSLCQKLSTLYKVCQALFKVLKPSTILQACQVKLVKLFKIFQAFWNL